jgi:hypothetical protein
MSCFLNALLLHVVNDFAFLSELIDHLAISDVLFKAEAMLQNAQVPLQTISVQPRARPKIFNGRAAILDRSQDSSSQWIVDGSQVK